VTYENFKVVGRVTVEFRPGHAPVWHEVVSCALCGSLVIGGILSDPASDLAVHTRWHEAIPAREG